MTLLLLKVHRHGDRSPLVKERYPNDPYNNHSWHGGPGALSQKGAAQLYRLGRTLRTNYSRLLPPDGLFTNQNMHVSSSSKERCLNSVQYLLAGFMPPRSNDNLLPISWQGVPIHYKPIDQDNV